MQTDPRHREKTPRGINPSREAPYTEGIPLVDEAFCMKRRPLVEKPPSKRHLIERRFLVEGKAQVEVLCAEKRPL